MNQLVALDTFSAPALITSAGDPTCTCCGTAMTLHESVGDWVLKNLPYDRANPKVVATLKEKRAGELLVLYLNWWNRLIARQPRHVARAPEFDRNPITAERSGAVAAIVRDIEHGHDLTKYLSRRVRMGFTLPPKPNKKQLGRMQYLDLLLNDWGIHHLHLSTSMQEDGFVERDDPLLFAIFRPDKTYLIDIGTHASFADDRLVRIVVATWPNDQLFFELQGIRGSRNAPYTPDERSTLRKAGLASFIQIGERVFMPPGGLSTAGTSTQATRQANVILKTLQNFEEHARDDPSKIVSFLKQHGGQPSEKLEFQFAVFDEGYGVIETTSGLPIRLSA